MKKVFCFLTLPLISYYDISFCFSLSEQPISSVTILTENKLKPLLINGRPRVASLSGVTWFHKNYLAVVHQGEDSIYIYKFNRKNHLLSLIQKCIESDGIQVKLPEAVAFNKKTGMLAISNFRGTINLYSLDKKTHHIGTSPVAVIRPPENMKQIHGIGFSSRGDFLAVTSINTLGAVCILKLEEVSVATKSSVTSIFNPPFYPKKPKSLQFSSDDAYVAIVYGAKAAKKVKNGQGLVAIHKFDKDKGIIETNPVCIRSEGINAPDDIKFSSDDKHIIIPNQGNDSVVIYDFDTATGLLSDTCVMYDKVSLELSFPHGISVSEDSRYVAIANFGNSQLSIFSSE